MDKDLKSCLEGDKQAWDALVRRYAGLVYSAVRRIMQAGSQGITREDLEDTVQDVFVRLLKDDYRLLRRFDPEKASFTTYLTVIARSVALDNVKKRKLPTVDLQPEVAESLSDHSPITHEQDKQASDLPLHLLTGRQKLVLKLLYDREMPVSEAAKLLNVDEQTIRSTKHKALTRLRQNLLTPKEENK